MIYPVLLILWENINADFTFSSEYIKEEVHVFVQLSE